MRNIKNKQNELFAKLTVGQKMDPSLLEDVETDIVYKDISTLILIIYYKGIFAIKIPILIISLSKWIENDNNIINYVQKI